jgi:integration host factor subunit alpha
MSLGKKDIAKNVSSKAQISNSISFNLVGLFFKTIKLNSKYNIVKLSNFGSFEKRVTPQRVGRNPKTKQEFLISKRSKLSFKASSRVKSILN